MSGSADIVDRMALIAGAYLIVTGIGFLVSSRFYSAMTEMGEKSDPVLINLSGAAHFIIGAIVILNAAPWRAVDEIVVAVVGLLALIKGGVLIMIPARVLKSGKQSAKRIRGTGLAFIAAGIGVFALGVTV